MKNAKSSLSTEIPPVKGAVEHLRELASKMRLEDADDVDPLVEALEEMEWTCKRSHEQLETVTIESSALRHRLRSFPVDFNAELSEALGAAHQLNAAQIGKLKSELNEIEEGIEKAIRRKEVVELHNAVLIPERRQLGAKHGELVAKLNSALSDKANHRISLNEAKAKLAAADKKIDFVDVEIRHVGKLMDKEREDTTEEKESLKQKIADATAAIERLNDENNNTKRRIEKLHDDLVRSGGVLETKRRTLKQAESSRDELLRLESTMKDEEAAARSALLTATNGTVDIVNDQESIRTNFAMRKTELIEAEKQLKDQLAIASAESGRVVANRKAVRSDLRVAKEKAERASAMLASVKETVNSSRRDLVRHSEECGRMRQEISELKFRKAQVEERHKADVALLSDSIADTRTRLAKERTERQRVQAEQSQVASTKVTVKQEQARASSAMTKRISSAVQRQEALKSESVNLKRALNEAKTRESALKQQLTTATTKYQTMKNELETTAKSLEASIGDLESRLKAANEKLCKTKPRMASLETECQEQQSLYDDKKKEIVALKNKKAGVEDAITRASREIERLHIPQEKLRCDIGKTRVDALLSMKAHVAESDGIELEIRHAEDKLRSVQTENARFSKGIEALRKDRLELETRYEGSSPAMLALEADLTRYRDLLEAGFHQSQELEKEQAARDRIVLSNMDTLCDSADKRQERVSKVHEKISHQLEILGNFLEAAASKKKRKKADRRNVTDTK
ncbi:coiled-coil domain-containing protein 175-like isoform X2 [Oscarella lobularis]|uniref:coiled-coil domain-containing protein 175-like isoform X2 n=1 Tax=Oscarella lobularis TaxID=121494 RepID=UPI0033143F3F